MENKPSESVLLLRIGAGNMEQLVQEIRENTSVRSAEPILGPYDIVVTGTFKDEAALTSFAKELEAKDAVTSVDVRPTRNLWTRDGVVDKPYHGWTFVRASNPDAAMKALQTIGTANRVYRVDGEYNFLVKFDVDDPAKLFETLTRDVRRIEGIQHTKTMTGFVRATTPAPGATPAKA